jgi:hypothetical protein
MGEHRVAFGPTKQTPTGPAGQHQSVAPNPTRRTLKSSRPKSREENTPMPSRPTDQDKRSVAPNQTGERSDGRPQSQSKNPSRHPTTQFPPLHFKGCTNKMGAQSHSQQGDEEHQQRREQARAHHTCTSKGGGKYNGKLFWRWGSSDRTLPTSTATESKGCRKAGVYERRPAAPMDKVGTIFF